MFDLSRGNGYHGHAMAVAERWKGTRPIELATPECGRRAARLVRRDARVRALYLFGSRAVEGGSSESDPDLAIWTTSDFRWQDLYDLRGSVTHAVGSERVDVVWLNRCDPVTAFQVLKTGRTLTVRDVDEVNDLELRAKRRFWDYGVRLRMHVRDRHGLPA